jgi:MFS family permease
LSTLNRFLAGNASWFLAVGIQSVLFSWLVTMVLHESPARVGVAQMALLLPVLLLLLVGGGLADRHGGARIAFVAQSLCAIPPLVLAAFTFTDSLNFGTMLVYGVAMGCLQAFVTPARDGLLNDVAGPSVQRAVMLASLTQFACQIVGVALAGLAGETGAAPLLVVQALIFLGGAVALRGLVQRDGRPLRAGPTTEHQRLMTAIVEGAKSVWHSRPMRFVCVQNVAMGLFFMGSFIVTSPLLVREVFSGDAADLSLVNGVNAAGLALTILLLLRFGEVTWPGRTLLLSQGIGAAVLLLGGLVSSLTLFVTVMFFWGICGGFAMTMARTIVQELAPAEQRGRIMAFYGFTFTGAGPFGALLNGALVSAFGAQGALMIVSAGMIVVILIVGLNSPLWALRSHHLSAATR